VKIKPKFTLPKKAELHVQKVCRKFDSLWAQFEKTKQAPKPDGLIGSIKSQGRKSDEARFELSRRLLEIDLKHRSRFDLPVGPDVYGESAILKCLSAIEAVDASDLANMLESPEQLTVPPKSESNLDAEDNNANTVSISPGDTNSMHESNGFEVRPWQFLDPPSTKGDLGRIGDYRIISKLGSGGMGTVFLAEDTNLLRNVAIKVLHEGSESEEHAQQRFLRECRAMAAIESDHVIQVYHVGEFKNTVFMVMPVLKGETLGDRLAAGPMDNEEAFRIAREIALGLSAAHQKGLTHRDIKPANIWLDGESATVKILDFGLVRHGGDSLRTIDGAVLGTPRYMSPEQARGEKADSSSDLFSLGAVLYQMLSGHQAFEGETLYSLLISVSNADYAPIVQKNPRLDPNAVQLVNELLAKDPENRPSSASEVVSRLDSLINQASPTVNTSLDSLVAQEPAKQTRAKQQNTSGSWFRRWSVAIALAAFFAVALTSIIVLKFRGKDGTVVVELDGEAEISEIEIDGNRVSFETKDGKIEFNVDPGEHSLSIKTPEGTKLGTSLTEEKLTIGAGQNLTVRAFWKPDEVDPEAGSPREMDSTPGDKYRRAAEWVLGIGGEIRINQNGKRIAVKKLSELPSTTFTITLIHLGNNNEFKNSDLAILSGLTELELFSSWNSSLSDEGLAVMTNTGESSFPSLGKIDFAGCLNVTGKGIEYFRSSPIKSLGVRGTGVNDLESDLPFTDYSLSGNVALVEWMCENCPEDLERASAIAPTSDQEIGGNYIGPVSLELMKKIPDVNELDLRYSESNREFSQIWRSLGDRKNLTELGLTFVDGNSIEDVGLDPHHKLSNIRRFLPSSGRVEKFSSITGLMPKLRLVTFHNMEFDTDAFRENESPESGSTIEEIKFQSTRGDFSKENAIEVSKTLPNCKVYWDGELVAPVPNND